MSSPLPSFDIQTKSDIFLSQIKKNPQSYYAFTEKGKFIGVLDSSYVQYIEDNVAVIRPFLQQYAVEPNEHLLHAYQKMVTYALPYISVIDEEENLIGSIDKEIIFNQIALFLSLHKNKGGIIILETDAHAFSCLEVVKMIESNDYSIEQLNIYTNPTSKKMNVSIKVNKIDVSCLIASFERYGYTIKYFWGEDRNREILQSNYNQLIKYLSF